MADIRAGHIAADQNRVGVVRTDGWMEHRATTAGPNNLEISRAGLASVDTKEQG
jgi:hypothetical protein